MKTTGHFDTCPHCHQRVGVRTDGRLRIHGPVGKGCAGNYEPAPAYATLATFPWQEAASK